MVYKVREWEKFLEEMILVLEVTREQEVELGQLVQELSLVLVVQVELESEREV